jgi:phosphoglycolate phosphatase
MYRAYVFDFDYTLVNSEQGIAMCFELLLADKGYPAVPREKICRTIGKPMIEAMSIVTGETDPKIIEALCQLYKTGYADKYMTPNTHLYPETLPALQRIKKNGSLAVIVSTKTSHRIGETIIVDHLEHLIDAVIGVQEVSKPKPDPEGLHQVMKRFDLKEADILYVGDSTIDAETAKNAGVDFAAVTTGMTTAAEFEPYPYVKIMKTLAELP